MKKEIFGAALFFCGFGIFLTLFCPIEGWGWWLLISTALMLSGVKITGCH